MKLHPTIRSRPVKALSLAGFVLLAAFASGVPLRTAAPEAVAGEARAATGGASAIVARGPNDLARAIHAASPPNTSPSPGLARDLALATSVGAPERAVVVDIASARLWLLQHGAVVDTMKVIVGRPDMATPEMTGAISYVTLNPYWNIPPDIVRDKIAPRVIASGVKYLHDQGYQVVERYGLEAAPLDPQLVDWTAVSQGALRVGVRQLPGPTNMMGAAKFIFPNNLGIYLHDTPHRAGFQLEDRRLSSGCVRVERAADLYRWIFGSDLASAGESQAERRVLLARPVPVYLFGFSPEGGASLSPEALADVARSRSAVA